MTPVETIRTITCAEQGQYIEVPFNVPTDAEAVSVKYAVKPLSNGACTVDLGIADPVGLRGWSGGARKEVMVSLERATPGYKAGPLTPGSWAAVLGAYEVPQAGCEVTVSVQVEMKQHRWRPGDLHLHTVHSDGKLTVTDVAERAHARGLEFIALTDHNTVTQNLSRSSYCPVTLIPGCEWSSYTGHANLYGVDEPLTDFRCTTTASVTELLRGAKTRGAKVSLNHILDNAYASGVWRWGYDVTFDWVEIWNGPWRASNQAALEWWDNELRGGRRLPAVGGSDFHRPSEHVDIGRPTTWVCSNSGSSGAILDAVTSGRASISFDPAGPLVEAWCGQFTFGDIVAYDNLINTGLNIKVQRGKGDRLVLTSALGQLWTAEIDADQWSTHWSPPQRLHGAAPLYLRLELWRRFAAVDQVCPSALSNPLYIK